MNVRYTVAGVAAILWVASFLLPAVKAGGTWMIGWEIAASGWAGPLLVQFGWYANLLMIPALGALALGGPSDAGGMSKLGLFMFLFWINTLFWKEITWDGGTQQITERGLGFYAWMGAVLIAWLGLFILVRRIDPAQRVGQIAGGNRDTE